jgi:NADH-quinone oxidoreductase subunit I
MAQYFRDIFAAVWTVLVGMKITLRHLFTRSVTLQYPDQRLDLPKGSRMRLFNKIEDCIGCGQCVRACPVDCIWMVTEKRGKEEPPIFASDGTPIKLRVTQFDIDMSLCCYCNLCTYPCPTHCLYMTPDYEFATYDKQDFLYRFAKDKPLAPPKALHSSAAAPAQTPA